MSSIPTEFPTGGALDLAAVVRTQVQATVAVNKAALAVLRAKYGEALAEASVEGQAIAALQAAIDKAGALLPLLL
jgi:hypothetical protein